MKPHKHAAVIHAYADGAQVQIRNPSERQWRDCNYPDFDDVSEYRIKPVAPETRMTLAELENVSLGNPMIGSYDFQGVANAAIARALADGDVVLPEAKSARDFNRDITVAHATQKACMALLAIGTTAHQSIANCINLQEIVDRIP